ncbi:MAG: nucleotidyltransferase [Candidatus Aminicenantales bacterium]
MDTEKLLRLLKENKVDFLVIGASAFPVYGYARATLDVDIFIKADLENIKRVIKALQEFGYDLMDLSPEDFLKNKILIRQYDVEADIHPFVKGLTFPEAWKNKIKAKFGETEVYFPSLDDMIKMKKAAGRTIDREDLKFLIRIREKESKTKKLKQSE